MSLCERPTHWLPQNPISFIINKLLLIIQALLHTMHVLYMKGRKREEKEAAAGWEEGRKRDSEEEKWLEREAQWRCGIFERGQKKQNDFGARGRRG